MCYTDDECYVVAYHASCLDLQDAIRSGKAILVANTSDFTEYPDEVADYVKNGVAKALEYNAQLQKMLPSIFVTLCDSEEVAPLLNRGDI